MDKKVMDEYVKTLVCRALMDMAADYAICANKDPELLVEQALLDASIAIKKFGQEQVRGNLERHHPRLHSKAFAIDEVTKLL